MFSDLVCELSTIPPHSFALWPSAVRVRTDPLTCLPRVSGSGRRYYKQESYKPITMNDLPVPRGSWQQHYANKQKNYNLTLAGGMAFFGCTAFIVSRWRQGVVRWKSWRGVAPNATEPALRKLSLCRNGAVGPHRVS